jgi:hypothetical protein
MRQPPQLLIHQGHETVERAKVTAEGGAEKEREERGPT